MYLKTDIEFKDWDFREIFINYIFYARPDLNKYHEEIIEGLWEWTFAHDTKAEYLIRMIETLQLLKYQDYKNLDEDEQLNCIWKDGEHFIVFE